MKPFELPHYDDPELDWMAHHPAIKRYLEAQVRSPHLFTDGTVFSFRRLIADYEEELGREDAQQALIKRLDDHFAWLAENPPLKDTKRPQELTSFTYEFHPSDKSGRKYTQKMDIQMPASTSKQTQDRLLFEISSVLKSLFELEEEPPDPIVMTTFFKGAMLERLREMRINVFRFALRNPEPNDSHDTGQNVYV